MARKQAVVRILLLNLTTLCLLALAVACGPAETATAKAPPPWTHKLRKEKDTKGEWRWYVKAVNGNDIAGSTEGYKNKEDMDKSLWALVAAFRDETVQGLP